MNTWITNIAASMALIVCTFITTVNAQPSSPPASKDAEESAASTTDSDSTPPEVIKSTIISRDVTVRTGDTLPSIAAKELGKSGFAPQLAEFNRLSINASLESGTVIRIPIHVPARGEFAQVIFVKGDVELTRPKSSSQTSFNTLIVERDSDILSGDTIITGSDGYISIEFSSGSIVNMQPETEAMLSRLNCLPGDDSCVIEIKTKQGKVTSDINAREDQPVDFRIRTPYASAAVRGTQFDVNANDTLRVSVTEGIVDLSAPQAQPVVKLEAGFGSIVKPGQAPSKPVALLPPPVFKSVPTRLAAEDAIAWWGLGGAAFYNALITTDENGREALASYKTDDDEIGFNAIASGDYYLLLRAIDEYGLGGFTSNTRITIAQIDEDTAPVDTLVTKQGREFLVKVQNPPENAAGFEIQIANNEAFDDPLSVDVNANGSAVFRLDNDRVYSRARVLLDPFTVSAYGKIASSDD